MHPASNPLFCHFCFVYQLASQQQCQSPNACCVWLVRNSLPCTYNPNRALKLNMACSGIIRIRRVSYGLVRSSCITTLAGTFFVTIFTVAAVSNLFCISSLAEATSMNVSEEDSDCTMNCQYRDVLAGECDILGGESLLEESQIIASNAPVMTNRNDNISLSWFVSIAFFAVGGSLLMGIIAYNYMLHKYKTQQHLYDHDDDELSVQAEVMDNTDYYVDDANIIEEQDLIKSSRIQSTRMQLALVGKQAIKYSANLIIGKERSDKEDDNNNDVCYRREKCDNTIDNHEIMPAMIVTPEKSSRPRTRTAVVSPTLESLADGLSHCQFQNVVVVMGAGASVSAGIPDFRTPGTGLYHSLSKYNLPYPEAVFDFEYYTKVDPRPFVDLSRSLWPGQDGGPHPTTTHAFLKVLQDRGILRRVYTQNIDGLEALAGVDTDKLVECHGHFRSASCTKCRAPADIEDCMNIVFDNDVPICSRCSSVVKPDIAFFGEDLPKRFENFVDDDTEDCDLLIVIGTSLSVMPVAGIPQWVNRSCPRLLLNREKVGDFGRMQMHEIAQDGGIEEEACINRDVLEQGDCDDGVRRLCNLAGWDQSLEEAYVYSKEAKSL